MKSKYSRIHVLVLACVVAASHLLITSRAKADGVVDSCAEPQGVAAMNACARKRLDEAEAALNLTYRGIVTALSKPDAEGRSQKLFRDDLVKAQRIWIDFREAECSLVLDLNAEGAFRTSMYLGCKRDLAVERETRLRELFPEVRD